MSHDVKTPMTGVVSAADIIANDKHATDQHRQLAKMIFDSGKQVVALFDNCIELAKLEMLEFTSEDEVFSFEKLLKGIHQLFIPSSKDKALNFSITCDIKIPKLLKGQRASIYRIALNLISNALKFTQEGGISVRSFLAKKINDTEVQIGLEIKDTGIGIPSDQQKVIFEKLRRLTPSYEGKTEGSGIGLYIVDQYVKRMGGTIHVISQPGKGSIFTVLLPLTIAKNISLLENEKIDQPIFLTPLPTLKFSLEKTKILSKEAPRILLVEDAPMIQYVTQILLNDAGFHVDVAGTGHEALEKFSLKKYDLIYVDIGLPDMDGYETTQAIRLKEKANHVASTPIIALTGHGAVDIHTFCAQAGMQGVLSKPLIREQAEKVWQRFGEHQLVHVPGLTILQNESIILSEKNILDLTSTIQIVGSKEIAEKLLAQFINDLETHFIPSLKKMISHPNNEKLQFELHQMLGSLSYVKAAFLEKKIAELQKSLRNGTNFNELAYKEIEQTCLQVIKFYQGQISCKDD